MGATVFEFPKSGGGRPEEARLTDPLIQALRERALTLFQEMLGRMFEGADDALFEMSEKAAHGKDQHVYLDAMRRLRLERERVEQAFVEAWRRFAASAAKTDARSAIGYEQLELQPQEALEESIALSNLRARADGAGGVQFWELERRLASLLKGRGVDAATCPFSPGALCDSFGSALQVLALDMELRLVVYKLFERVVASDLEPVYAALIAFLDEKGVHAAPVTLRGAGPRGAAPKQLDAATVRTLEQLAGAAAAVAAAPGVMAAEQLATRLTASLHGGVAAGTALEAGALERVWLAGQMLNGIVQDPQIPDAVRKALEPLRLPLIRTALTDPSFVANPRHPLRITVYEIATMGAVSRASGADMWHTIESLVGEVVEQTMRGAAAVARGAADAQMEPADTEAFLKQQEEQTQARRNALVAQARRTAENTIRERIRGIPVSPALRRLLDSGLGPVLGIHLLRYGYGSSVWNESVALLDKLLDCVRPRSEDAADAEPQRRAVATQLAQTFAAVGMEKNRIKTLLETLQNAFGEAQVIEQAIERAKAPEPQAPPPAVVEAPAPKAAEPPARDDTAELLRAILRLGTWFRVHDAAQDITRWLRLSACDFKQGVVVFSQFEGSDPVRLPLPVLIEDLIADRAAPVSPDAEAVNALMQLRANRSAAKPSGQN